MFENYHGPTADPWPAYWLVPPIQVDQAVLVDQAVQVDQASALVVQPVALGQVLQVFEKPGNFPSPKVWEIFDIDFFLCFMCSRES